MRRLLPWFLGAILLSAPALAQADDVQPIAAAEEAWAMGEIAKAGTLYEKALVDGGLPPSDTIAALVRAGAYRASKNNTQGALSAFRMAVIIDPTYEYPEKAGAKGKALYERAQKEASTQVPLAIELTGPKKLKPEEPFEVTAALPEQYAPLFEALTIRVDDGSGTALHVEEKPSDASVTFEIPGSAAAPGSSIEVRVSAIGAQKNEWVRSVLRFAIDAPKPPPAALAPVQEPPPPAAEKGFFQTKWPFVIGGGVLAVAAAVVVVAVVASSSPTAVNINAPTWQSSAGLR
jgi:hypothetical protein